MSQYTGNTHSQSQKEPVMDALSPFICKEFLYQEYHLPTELFEQFAMFREEESFTDVVINLGNQSFKCHRVILAAASPYFRALFKHEINSEVNLPNMNPSVFKDLLGFMYTSKLEIKAVNACDLLDLADYLHFRPIVHYCADILLQNISRDNAVSILILAEGHTCHPLADAAKKFIHENLDELLLTDEFVKMPHDFLQELLTKQAVSISSEENLARSISDWINADIETRLDFGRNLFNLVHLEHCSKDLLKNLEENFSFVPNFESGLQLGETNDHCSENRPTQVVAIVPQNLDQHKERSRSIMYYNPMNSKWTELTSLPSAMFPETVELQRIAVLDNCIYFTGGSLKGIAMDRVVKYDIVQDIWSDVASMKHSRYNHGIVAAFGYIYVFGGRMNSVDNINTLERYNPKTNKWTLLEGLPVTIAPTTEPILKTSYGIANCDLVQLGHYLYIVGGTKTNNASIRNRVSTDPPYKYHNVVEGYNLLTNSWTHAHHLTKNILINSMSLHHGTCLQLQGLLLVIDEDLKAKHMKLYNPVTHQMWDFMATQGQHRFGGYVLQKNMLYAIGGMMSGFRGALDSNDMAHRTALGKNSNWEMLEPLPFGISHYTAVSIAKVCKP